MCILSSVVKLCGLEKAQFLIKETFIASHFKDFCKIEIRRQAGSHGLFPASSPFAIRQEQFCMQKYTEKCFHSSALFLAMYMGLWGQGAFPSLYLGQSMVSHVTKACQVTH